MSTVTLVRRIKAAPIERFLGRTGAPARRMVRFGLVGASGILVNSALLALLVQFGHLRPAFAGAMATEAAIVSNFALHDRWTFRDAHAGGWGWRAIRYNLSALGGLLTTVAALTALTNGLHLYYLIANLFAVGAGCLCNYLLSCRFAWAVADADRTALAAEQGAIAGSRR